jgi:hypothetical protein
MQTLLGPLQGKKSYLIALAGLVYAIGIHFGWWTNESEIWGALASIFGLTLRAGIKTAVRQIAITVATDPDLKDDVAGEAARRFTAKEETAAAGGPLPPHAYSKLRALIAAAAIAALALQGAGCAQYNKLTPDQKVAVRGAFNQILSAAVSQVLTKNVSADDLKAKQDLMYSAAVAMRSFYGTLPTAEQLKERLLEFTANKSHWIELADSIVAQFRAANPQTPAAANNFLETAATALETAPAVAPGADGLPPANTDPEHWSNRVTDRPETSRKLDENGMPNFGPKPSPSGGIECTNFVKCEGDPTVYEVDPVTGEHTPPRKSSGLARK